MQQVQDQLGFRIETPDDAELARRFADRQKELTDRLAKMAGEFDSQGFKAPPASSKPCQHKPRNRKSKQQKKQERMNREAENAKTE